MLWKGKKKRKIGGVRRPERVIAQFGFSVATEKFYHDRVSLALGRGRVFCVAVGSLGRAHDTA